MYAVSIIKKYFQINLYKLINLHVTSFKWIIKMRYILLFENSPHLVTLKLHVAQVCLFCYR